MSNVISLFSATRGRRAETSKAPATKAPEKPSGPIVGTCARCGKPISERDFVEDDNGRQFHFFSCLMDDAKLKGWKSSLGWIFWRLARPFAKALGRERVQRLIDPFFDQDLTFAETFKAFVELEQMLRTTPGVTEDQKMDAIIALAEAKNQLRLYARLP